MKRTFLHAKIHRATVTEADIDYVGSISIDPDLMDAAGLIENEQVHVLDVDNGNRLVTYAIRGGPGQICLNGAAARLVAVGDIVLILAYCDLADDEIDGFEPTIVHVSPDNAPISAAEAERLVAKG